MRRRTKILLGMSAALVISVTALAIWIVTALPESYQRQRDDYASSAATSSALNAIVDDGEHLHYAFRWRDSVIGTGDSVVQALMDAPDALQLELRVQTLPGMIATLYPVNSTYRSRVARDDGRSLHYLRDRDEGGKRKKDSYTFDHAAGTITRTRYDFPADGGEHAREPVTTAMPQACHDPVAILFHLRHLPLAAGSTHDLPLLDKRGLGVLTIHCIEATEVTLPQLGNFSAWRLQLTVAIPSSSGSDELTVTEAGEQFEVWVDQASGTVLRATASGIPVLGSVHCELVHGDHARLAGTHSSE